MRLPRMTVRGWMILIAICAAAMGARVYLERKTAWKAYCRDRVRYHVRWEKEYRTLGDARKRSMERYERDVENQELSEPTRKRLRYLIKINIRSVKDLAELTEFHRQMKQKWERGSENIWLQAEPDPPDEALARPPTERRPNQR
jgi:hypothetical protein